MNRFNGENDINAADIDSDGDNDIDLLGMAQGGGKFSWFENNGDQTFKEHIISSNFFGSRCYSVDIDNDDDSDIIGTSGSQDEISLWKVDKRIGP